MVTATPSYFHGWSPDGKYLAYVLQHPGANGAPANYDIFRIPAAGGEPQQLDSNAGYDDGPDYSPDGKWIYFNSDRSGGWDVWRIPADGAGPGDEKAERITSDEMEDWFPHPSPDRKWLLFLSFAKGTATHNDKLPGTQLRMMPMPGARLGQDSADSGGDHVLRWPGNDQRQFLVARFQAVRLCNLRTPTGRHRGALSGWH